MLLQIHAKHGEETNNLREELNKFKDMVDKLEKDIKTQSTNTEQDTVDNKYTATVEIYEKWYNCNMCNYKVKKEITLKKHINTKHSRKEIPDGLAASYFCDDWEYSCHNKKSLKNTKPRTMKILVISAIHVMKSSSTRKTLILTLKRYTVYLKRKITKLSAREKTQLSATNAYMRMGGSTKH